MSPARSTGPGRSVAAAFDVTPTAPAAGPGEHRALAAVLLGSGVMHLVRPRVFDSIVPRWLPPSRRFWTVASGLAEIGVGLAVARPGSRRVGGYAAAGLFVAVFPANLWMAWLWRHRPLAQRVGVLARLPLQVPLVAWGLRVARSAAPGG
ncbi:hypothetical protein [Jannaschia sp. R86511]|uniref:DoxX family protein n=1 Tax=Jannaschia sp. R86511 TaxID=3093853 RepID=UPI0036D3C6C9